MAQDEDDLAEEIKRCAALSGAQAAAELKKAGLEPDEELKKVMTFVREKTRSLDEEVAKARRSRFRRV